MIYLMVKIFVYLFVAFGLGAVAGWLWRNLQAEADGNAAERNLSATDARVAKLESALRDSERRTEAVLVELEDREVELARRHERLAERKDRIAELERACAEMRQRLESARTEPAPVAEPEAGAIARAPADDDRPALEAALAKSRDELDRVQRALAGEQRKVEELTQERELQKRSLAALEQQLELAREERPRIANG